MPDRAIRSLRTASVALALVVGAASPALAQEGDQASTGARAAGVVATWSNDRLERVGMMLSGNWRSDAPVGSGADAANLMISVAPIGIEGIPDALYVEVARADEMWAPYRQNIWQLFDYKGNVRLRTYEFHNAAIDNALIDKDAFIGAWAMPNAFPPLAADNFIATLDIEGTVTANGFSGRTPAPYPTAAGGAVEMTSEINLTPTRLVTADRGFDAQGNVVWGQESGGQITYTKVEPTATVTRHDDGLIVVEYRSGTGRQAQTGDTFSCHYVGWFARTAQIFNSSRQMGRPFSYQFPGTVIEGWRRGTEGMRAGSLRRMYIPYPLAYKEMGQPPQMPPRSNLVFEVEALSVSENTAPAAPRGVDAPRGNANPAIDSASNPG
ncbi:MAG: CpcT/CpeT family chromophore lyase [Phycisphaerales bacterium]